MVNIFFHSPETCGQSGSPVTQLDLTGNSRITTTSSNPGLAFHGCDDLRVLHGVLLDEARPVTLRVGAGRAVKREGFYLTPRLVRERQFETVAMQSTLIDDREMTPNWADIDAGWKTRFFSDELIEHGRRPLYENRVSRSLACKRMTPC